MLGRTVAFTILVSALAAGTAFAQSCLHGPGETAEQAARRGDALFAARLILTLEFNQPGASSRRFLAYEELAQSYAADTHSGDSGIRISLRPGTEVLPKWKFSLDVTPSGFWFMIKDLADPCGFAYISNQESVIFRSEPIR